MRAEALLQRFYYRLLWQGRGWLLAVMLAITGLLLIPAAQIGVEQDNASMRGEDPAARQAYQAFRERFGSDDLLLLGLQHPRLLSPEGLALLERLTGEIESMPGVRRVFSLSNARVAVPGPYGAEPAPLLPSAQEPDFAAARDRQLERYADQAARFLSADRRTAMLLVLPGEIPGEQMSALIDALRRLGGQLPEGAALRVTGVPVQKADVARAIQHDQRALMPLAVVVLGALLALLFRRPAGVLLPLAAMAISLVWTLGLYALAGFPLNAITALLPPVVMVLTVAASVHVFHGWLSLAGERGEPRSLLAHRMAELFSPCFFTALTTMIGMFSLVTCDIPAVQRFGIFAGIGVMVAFVVTVTLLPVALTFLPLPQQTQRRRNRLLSGSIRRLFRPVIGRPGMVLGGCCLLAALAVPLAARIGNNTDLVRFFRADAPIHRDTLALDQATGGVVPLEFMISRRDGGPLLNADLVNRLAAWREELRQTPQVSGSLSLLDLLIPLYRAERDDPAATLPRTDAELLPLLDLLPALPEQELVAWLLSADQRHLRVTVQLPALGSAAASRLGEELRGQAARLLGDEVTVIATGSYLEISNDSNRLVGNLLQSFVLSLVTIFVTLAVLLRNVRLLLAAIVPNLLPLAWTAGLMGWAGIDLSSGTAMVAAVTMGMAVDNTIHFLERYRREHRGYSRPALLRTALGVGPAMIISTIVLAVGFWVGAFSSFLPSVYFSLMTGVTLVGALFCDLAVLPAGLLLLDRLRPARALPALGLLAAGLALSPGLVEAAPPVPLAAERQDLPVRWSAIPRTPPHVGTLRLLKRDTAVVLQTDLETTVLRRVFAAIREREERRWPAAKSGHDEMRRYLGQLEEAVTLVEQRVAARPADQDRRRRLQIEFIADPPRHEIVLLTREPGGPWEAFPPLAVSATYLYGDMLTILGENLAESPAEALAVLRPLLPRGTPLPETRP